MPLRRDSLNSGDVFVLCGGLAVFLWNGKESNSEERERGAAVAASMAPQPNAVSSAGSSSGASSSAGAGARAAGPGGGDAAGGVVVLEEDVSDGPLTCPGFWELLPPGKDSATAGALGGSLPGGGGAGVETAAAAGDDDDVEFHMPVLWRWDGVEAGLPVRQGYATASFDAEPDEGPDDSLMKFKRAELRRDEVKRARCSCRIELAALSPPPPACPPPPPNSRGTGVPPRQRAPPFSLAWGAGRGERRGRVRLGPGHCGRAHAGDGPAPRPPCDPS